MTNYVKALDINTAGAASVLGVANTTQRAYNNADFDIIETRVQLDW